MKISTTKAPREHTSSTVAPSFPDLSAPKAPKAPAAPKPPAAPIAPKAPKQFGGSTVQAPKQPKISSRLREENGM